MTDTTLHHYPYWHTPDGPRPFRELRDAIAARRTAGARVISTNGCFDLLHAGHATYLTQARELGDLLVVGINSDASVARVKGAGRPLTPEPQRAALLAALRAIDYVLVFDDPTPEAWLAALRPDAHCKAGDYDAAQMPETAAVRAGGGEVCILPLVEGMSTTALLARALSAESGATPGDTLDALLAGANVLRQTAYRLAGRINEAADRIADALRAGGQVLACGNGGSAAYAQHFAAELVGRFKCERPGWRALALTVDTSILTSVGNDYGFEQVYARQVEAHGRPGDVLIAISTSGTSGNILAAAQAAKDRGMAVLALTGAAPSPLGACSDILLDIPSTDTPLIQQAHMAALHAVCARVEQALVEAI